MIYLLVVLILILLIIVVYLFTDNYKIRDEHTKNIQKLQGIIFSLHLKQKHLNEKVMITTEFSSNYSKDMKALGDEVVTLQKVFLEIISNRNNK